MPEKSRRILPPSSQALKIHFAIGAGINNSPGTYFHPEGR
jgi:hypothetical protein